MMKKVNARAIREDKVLSAARAAAMMGVFLWHQYWSICFMNPQNVYKSYGFSDIDKQTAVVEPRWFRMLARGSGCAKSGVGNGGVGCRPEAGGRWPEAGGRPAGGRPTVEARTKHLSTHAPFLNMFGGSPSTRDLICPSLCGAPAFSRHDAFELHKNVNSGSR